MANSEFCPCTDYSCSFHPRNHDQGCTLCVEDSLKCKELPKCFFIEAAGDSTGRTDWSFEAFAELFRK